MRRLTLLGLLAAPFIPAIVPATVPVAPIEVTLEQPDGTTIQARPTGNAYNHRMETLDGRTIVQDRGIWVYAEKDAAGQLVPTALEVGDASAPELEAIPLHLAESVDPSVLPEYGPVHRIIDSSRRAPSPASVPLLTVLVSFTDVSITYGVSSWDSLVYGATDSVADFYDEQSYGAFSYTKPAESQGTSNDGIISVSLDYDHPDFGGSFGAARNLLVADAMDAADSFIDYSAFDSNSDGIVDSTELSFMMIVAGYETAYAGAQSKTPNVWGHKSTITAVTHDGVDLSPFTMFGESHAISGGSDRQATIGIMCHELGHLTFGFPDLYDTDNSSNGIGEWGLMGSGSWNGLTYSGDSPAHLVAYNKHQTGMLSLTDVDSAEGVNLAPIHSNAEASRVWIDPYKVGEYFIIENRANGGYDAGLPGFGMLITHINPFMGSNAIDSNRQVDVEEADGFGQLDSKANRGDGGDVWPGTGSKTTFNNSTSPNTKDNSGAATNIALASIAAAGANVTASVTPTANMGTKGNLTYVDRYNTSSLGFSTATIWTAISVSNSTSQDEIDGVDVYLVENSTVDVYVYDSIAGSTLGTQLHSQTGFAGTTGWNRFLFSTPQSFPSASTRVIVLRIQGTSSGFPAAFDLYGETDGNCWVDGDGSGAWTSLAGFGDLAQFVLLGTAPTNSAPLADAGGPYNVDEEGNVGLSGSGSDPDVGDTLTYSWDLDNDSNFGETGGAATRGAENVQNPTFSAAGLNGPGSFDVTLRVSDGTDSDDHLVSITINNVAPTASAGGPYAVNEGSTVGLGASGSDAHDGLTYAWDLDNDNVFGETGGGATRGNETGQNVTFSAAGVDGPGSAPVKVRVSDDVTFTQSSTINITINNVAPTADAGGTYNVNEGATVLLAGSGSDGVDTLTYSWDLDGDSNFGETGAAASRGDENVQNPTFNAAAADGPAVINVTLRVNDGTTNTDDTATVNVANVAPTAEAGGPYNGNEDGTVNLAGTGSDVVDSVSYSWDLDNDGIYGESGGAAARGDENVQNPIFNGAGLNDGAYGVSLRVADGTTFVSDSATVDLANVAPTADAGGPYNVDEGETVALAGSGTDPVDSLTYTWDLDEDGIFGESGVNALNGDETGQAPTFDADDLDGVTNVTVTVRVSDGTVSTDDTASVTINNVAPTADAGGPYAIAEGSTGALVGTGTDPVDTLTYEWDLDEDNVFGETGAGAAHGDEDVQNPTFDASALTAPDSVVVTLRVSDDDGAISTDTASVSITDASAPTVDVADVSPDPRNALVSSVAINFSEDVQNFDIDDISLTRDASPVSLASANLTGGPQGYTLGNLDSATAADGAYVLTVNVSDITDLSAVALAAPASDTWVMDSTGPIVSITDPTPDPRNTAVGSIAIIFSENVSNFDVSDITLERDSVGVSLAGATLNGGPKNFSLDGLSTVTDADGSYEIVVAVSDVTDGLGNALQTSSSQTFVVDATAPVTTLDTADSTQVAGAITGTYTSIDAGVGGGSVTLYVQTPGSAVWNDAGTINGGTFSYTPSVSGDAADGSYYFTGVATDSLGNSEPVPACDDCGLEIIYNDTANSVFDNLVDATGTYVFPMESDLDVIVTVDALSANGLLRLTRTEGDQAPAGYSPADMIDQFLTFTEPDGLVATDATIVAEYDTGLLGGVLETEISHAYRDTGSGVEELAVITDEVLNTVTVETTGFSTWYFGIDSSSVGDWNVLE